MKSIDKPTRKRNMVARICNLLFFMIVFILLVGGGVIFSLKLAGYQTFCALGTSMEEKIGAGSLIFMKEVPEEELHKGDIIVFKTEENDGRGIIREIYGVNTEKSVYKTKAEQSQYPDAIEVTYGQILGKVWKAVPYAGFVILFFQTKCGYMVVIGIILLLIMLQLLSDICEKKEKLPKKQKK